MKLVNHQLIAAEAGRIRPKQESRGSDPVEPVAAIARNAATSSYEQSPLLPKPYQPINSHAVNFYSYTASLVAESGELIGIDTYA